MAGISKSEKARVSMWQKRTMQANKVYTDWEDDWKVPLLQKYWAGKHWANETEEQNPYTINLCFPTVEAKIPGMYFFNPKINVTPDPAQSNDLGSLWDARVQLIEDTTTTFMNSRHCGFADSVRLALRESFFRFGVVEVGYSAEWLDNPNAGKPALREDGREMEDVLQPEQVVTAETVFFKHIPAKQFRVSAHANPILERNDWFGYYEWVHLDDLKKHPTFGRKANKIAAFGQSASDSNMGTDSDPVGSADDRQKAGMVKLWKIWSTREKKRYVFPDIGEVFLVDGEPYQYSPLAVLRFHEFTEDYYPLPPMANWLSPQDELNETRQMARVHRRRFYRRYLVKKGIDQKELQKLETGGDGVYIEVADISNSIRAVEDAPLDRATYMAAGTSKEDFQNITASGGESRGVAESGTATQANIIDKNMQIRDNFSRQMVANWMSDILRALIYTLIEKMALPFVIKVNVDPAGPMVQQEVMNVANTWKLITSEELGGYDYSITVDVESLSPVNDDIRRNQWSQVLALFGNPALMMVMLSSDTILRKTLDFYGIKSDREVTEVRNAMISVTQMMQGGGPAGPGGAPPQPKPAAGQVAPGPRPNNADVSRQIAAQGV